MNIPHTFAFLLAAALAATRAAADRGVGGALYEHNGHTFESIQVISYSGAHCTLRRDDGVIAEVSIPDAERTAGVSETVVIDVTKSKSPIVASCKLKNRNEIKTAFGFQPQRFYAQGPMCLSLPATATPAQQAEANECQRRRFWSYTVVEYPETMRVVEPTR